LAWSGRRSRMGAGSLQARGIMDLFEDAAPAGNAPEFTVSEISGAVKRVIEGEFGRVRVRGEIGRVSRPASGHFYLDLKDDRAVLAAVIWKGTARSLAVAPEDGMEVVATGRLTTFPGSSRYQMIIEEIAPAGVGALMAMLEKRKAALAAEGLFAAERKRALPFLPEVIGVVTSPSGAVIRDILHRLGERFPRRVLVWPVRVQGKECAAEVASAIRGFNALAPGGAVPRPDLLIVARGGGSLEDLWGFNEEIVVRAAAEGTIPLISAVGHETDTTLIDLAADRRAPTPSAAAEMAVPVRLDLMAGVAGLEDRRRLSAARGIARLSQRLRDVARGLPRADALVSERAQRLDALALRLPRALEGLAREKRLEMSQGASGRFGPGLLAVLGERKARALAEAARDLPRAFSDAAGRGAERVARAGARLRPEALVREIGRREERLRARAERLDRAGGRQIAERRGALAPLARSLVGLDPESVMARGYAIVRDESGRVLTRAAEARVAKGYEIAFADGRILARPVRKPRRSGPGAAPDQGTLL
jgi:exodeoxyribonuclease VII large subunit